MPAAFKPLIDANLSEWTIQYGIDTPGNFVAGYALYGTADASNYYIAVRATNSTDSVIGAGTVFSLNTDPNATTGYSPFASIGADYNVLLIANADGTSSPYLYTGAAGENLVSLTPLTYALSPDGKSLDLAIPRNLVTPVSGPAPASINIAAEISNGSGGPGLPIFAPTDYSNPEFVITEPATLLPKIATHRVANVYSVTSANHYFCQTAYADLFVAAQNQARMAGVSYDIIDELELTNINNLIWLRCADLPGDGQCGFDAAPNDYVDADPPVYNYHIGIITAGDFLTDDQTGAALPRNSYPNIQTLEVPRWRLSSGGM